ncbi:MAG: hypothetical protein BroJett011_18110 [Chloroflexota bacterium]|nr:MAG: hypothetical protein BroJett011_18110 [Chloroflexota bacterium]
MPSEIEILYGDEPEAQQRLQAQGGNATVLSKGPSAPSSYKDSTASSISDLYKDWPAGSKPTKPQSRKPVPPSKAPPSTTKKPSSASLFQPRLNVPTKVIDFGKIQAGQEQSQFLEVTNTGSGPLHVMVNTAVQWLTVTPMQLICVAGETKRITVSFKNNFNPDQLFDLIRKDASELSASKKQANPTVNEFVIPSAITLVSIGGSESIGVSVKLPSSPALAPAPASIKQMWIDFSKGLKQILKK